MSDIAAQLAECVRAARRPLCIRGAGSKDFYGNTPCGEALDVHAHAGIVAYEPTELFITARCGTPLAAIEAVLAERGQYLPFEPPRFAAASTAVGVSVGGATVGGAVAAGLSGPRRVSAGSLRDYVLGVKLLDGAARELDFGGQVMKNVAGYDVSRLIAGSLGTLGVILEVSLKVLPKPVADRALRFEASQADALEKLNRWAGQPLPIVASAWHDGVLTLRLAGARTAVAAAEQKLGATGTALQPFWDELRDQRMPFFLDDMDHAPHLALWRLSLPATAPPLALPGETLIEWGGALRWLRTDAPAATIRAAAAAAGGNATLYRATAALKAEAGAFAPLPAPLLALQRRLKAVFDPRGLFNPGRLYTEF